MRHRSYLATVAIVVSLALAAAPAAGGELAGVTMPDRLTVGEQSFVLNGMALRKKAVFKVYVGGLYLPARDVSWKAVLDRDAPRHMVMHWVRSVDKEPICDGWYEGLEANTPQAGAELKKQFDTLCSYMGEVRSGDTFEFTYLPGTGTTVTVKGERKGTLEGKAFADALFASWIGPHPGPGEDFRADLMGQ